MVSPPGEAALLDCKILIAYITCPRGASRRTCRHQLRVKPLAGTENATQPFFSQDGKWAGFFSLGKMRKMPLHGGPATLLADAPVPHGASWTGDDTIVYAPK
jgi:hypothetical protein